MSLSVVRAKTAARLAGVFLCLILTACQREGAAPSSNKTQNTLHSKLAAPNSTAAAQHIQHYRSTLLASEQPALPLPLTGELAQVQALALAHTPLRRQLHSDAGKLRAEVMAVYPTRESDWVGPAAACASSRCFRIELFDFARNTTIVGTIDLARGRVLSWSTQVGHQAEIPDRLKDLAIQIAIDSPEVSEALGGVKPEFGHAQMARTKTALNGTPCERSKHLCVAPTFVQGNVAIWAIVDLTDFRLVGVQWTDVGTRADPESVLAELVTPSEQSLSDSAIMAQYCERNTALERMGWQLDYMLTLSDGLRISNVRHSGKTILNSAKLVDWHVNYSEREGFGYSDAVGCPSFSSAAVLPFVAPTVREIKDGGEVIGFVLEQEFRSVGWPGACNYSYRQSFEFYNDGSFRPTVSSIGAGCGNDGTYRPVLRIEPAGAGWQLAHWQGDQFKPFDTEQYFAPAPEVSPSGERFRLSNSHMRYAVEPGRGQFKDGRGDFEWVYATAHPPGRDEGASDLITIGPCCNTDYQQGPERYLNEEKLDQGVVFWYVPQLKNDTDAGREYCWARNQLADGVLQAQSFPCTAGPMFRRLADS